MAEEAFDISDDKLDSFFSIIDKEDEGTKSEINSFLESEDTSEKERFEFINEMVGQSPEEVAPQEKRKPTTIDVLRDTFSAGPKTAAIAGAALDPFVSLARGLDKSSASFYRLLDGGSKLFEAATGFERGRLFEQLAEDADVRAQALPATIADPITNAIVEMAGGTIPLLSEFALVPGGQIAKFATVQAIQEFEEKETASSLVEGALEGAATAMTFDVALTGGKILKDAGKEAAFKWMKGKVGPDAAREFVENPFKFNLNIFGKRKTAREIRNTIDTSKAEFSSETKRQVSDLKFKQENAVNEVKERILESKNKLSLAQKETAESLKSSQGEKLENLVANQTTTIQNANTAVTDQASNIYRENIQNFNNAKKKAGEAVGLAVKNTLEKNPGAGVSYQKLAPEWGAGVKKAPFNINKKGEFSLRTAGDAELKTEMNILQSLNQQFKHFGTKGGGGKLHLKYLEDVSTSLSSRATKAFSKAKAGGGKIYNELGTAYSEMAQLTNPANIAKKNKSLFPEITEANMKFGVVADNHKRAMKNYYKEDIAGILEPNPSIALGAIKGTGVNPKGTIKQLEKADSLLPEKERMLPKIRELVQNEQNIVQAQKSIIRNNKKIAKKEQSQLRRQQNEAIQAINKSSRTTTIEAKRNARTKVNELTQLRNEEYNSVIGSLERLEKRLADESLLTSFMVRENSLSRKAQAGGALAGSMGLVTSASGAPFAGSTALVGSGLAVALSPVVGANVTKLGLRGANAVESVLKPILQNQEAKKVVGATVMKELLRSKSKKQGEPALP
jgi:hypothetical protein